MKHLVLTLALFGSFSWAEGSADSAISAYKHTISGNLGWGNHNFIFGADYENAFDRNYGLGGLMRIYSKVDSSRGNPGMFLIGGFIRPHFTRGPWDLSVAPGLGLTFINAAGNTSSTTSFGPNLSIMLMYQLKNNLALGVEYFSLFDWTTADYRGVLSQDMTVKIRFFF